MKKRILIVSSRPLFPPIGGDRIRTFNTVKILSEKYFIDLIYLKEKDGEVVNHHELNKYCTLVEGFKFSKFRFFLNTILGFFKNRYPMQVNYYYFKKVQRFIDNLLLNHDYEFVFGFHIRTTRYLENYNGTKVVDLVDSIAMNYTKAIVNARGVWKFIYKIESNRVKKYEKLISHKYDKVVVTSNIDKEYIGNDEMRVIGNYVNFNGGATVKEMKLGLISFLGKMNYEPNISAVTYFINDVFPRLNCVEFELKFKIIGAFPTKDILKYKYIKGIEITGFVTDPYPLVCESHIVVAPMISGAGIQNKILEAMNLGKCVVTTKLGAEGLEDLKGNELIICVDTMDMVNKINDLLRHPEQVLIIGKNAKHYISHKFSYNSIKNKLLEFMEQS